MFNSNAIQTLSSYWGGVNDFTQLAKTSNSKEENDFISFSDENTNDSENVNEDKLEARYKPVRPNQEEAYKFYKERDGRNP